MVISDEIPAVPQGRKLSEFRSKPCYGRENNLEQQQLEKKTSSKPSEFRSKPSAEEKNSELGSLNKFRLRTRVRLLGQKNFHL
jgi:hypothetical protein